MMGNYKIGQEKYTNEYIAQCAQQCSTRNEFKQRFNGAYLAAIRRKILDKICSHMPKNSKLIYTKIVILEEALKYKSKKEFYDKSKGAYMAANRLKIMNEVTQHMIKMRHSIPQKICKIIFDKILNLSGIYNDRSIIKPFEIDIYYPELGFGIEYDGHTWHKDERYKREESTKRKHQKILEAGIKVIHINEPEKYNKTEIVPIIKSIIIDNLNTITNITNRNIQKQDIENVSVEPYMYFDIDKNLLIKELKQFNNITELQKKNVTLYRLIKQKGMEDILILMKKQSKYNNKNNRLILKKALREKKETQLITSIIENCNTYTDFLENKVLYTKAKNLSLVSKIRNNIFHTPKIKPQKYKQKRTNCEIENIRKMTDDELKEYTIKEYSKFSDINTFCTLKKEISKRGLTETIKHILNNGKRRKGKWTHLSDQQLLSQAMSYTSFKELQKQNKALYMVLYRKKLLKCIIWTTD